jgi:hypothetical protein
MKTKILMLLLVLAASTGLVAAISVSISGGQGGNSYSDNSIYQLAPETRLVASNVGGFAEATMTGAGYAEKNGVFVATDDTGVKSEITSAGGQTEIKANGMLVGADYGDIVYGSDNLLPGGSLMSGPAYTSDGGNPDAYNLLGRKWTQNNPNIQLYVNPSGSSFTASQMWGATTAAAETWDVATNQELFSGQGIATTAKPGAYDGRNTLGFLKFNTGCTALASAGTWYRIYDPATGRRLAGTVADPYHIVESDTAFNSNYLWSTTGESGKIDLQSVALHELGHTIGLGDIYNKAEFIKDTRQVMHYYTGIKRTLGNGDKTGVWKLYG